jgi:hypothetical protein
MGKITSLAFSAFVAAAVLAYDSCACSPTEDEQTQIQQTQTFEDQSISQLVDNLYTFYRNFGDKELGDLYVCLDDEDVKKYEEDSKYRPQSGFYWLNFIGGEKYHPSINFYYFPLEGSSETPFEVVDVCADGEQNWPPDRFQGIESYEEYREHLIRANELLEERYGDAYALPTYKFERESSSGGDAGVNYQ